MASNEPVAIVCVGMAGSGKTTFMQRINSYLHTNRNPPYVVNLDPAVRNVPFESNIDIRDSLNYKEVMREYNLGPNGGILTSLNIFATKIDQIIHILEKRTAPNPDTPQAKSIQKIIVDTPGQIEVFVWSASGSILLDTLASSFPTIIAYIIDTPRTSSPSTFMSNMLYACSILYKTKLPMILVFNKADVKDPQFAKDWMTDFETFQAALNEDESTGGETGGGGSGYMRSLLNSMSLTLEEFYKHLSVVGVSSMTGQGVPEFFAAVEEKAQEFKIVYRPELEAKKKQVREEIEKRKDKELGKMMQDMNVDRQGHKTGTPPDMSKGERVDTISDLEDQSDSETEARDDDESDEEAEGRQGQGLSDRFSNALPRESEEHSFARYLKASQIG